MTSVISVIRYSIADVGCDFEESATGYDWLYTINNGKLQILVCTFFTFYVENKDVQRKIVFSGTT